MAPKRLASDGADGDDQPKEKRIRSPIPYSFASVVGNAMTMKLFSNALEPWLRRVVTEEVERGIQKNIRTITRTPSFRIQAPEPATLKLVFTNKSLPPTLFTCNNVLDNNGEPLQLMLVEQRGDEMTPTILPYPIKVEIVVVNGDFPPSDRDIWTVEEFNSKVVKERDGKRPLLTRDVNYTVRDKHSVNIGDIEFTDNSSWIRSRKFRLGARVIAENVNNSGGGGVRVLEALTEPFVVKDHRGELYKKHYPPMLGDEVWRLEKIGKEGKFHKRLEQHGIKTVQDLLKLSVIDENKLKTILGGKSGVSEKLWDVILKHAKTCNLGNKFYISSGPNYTITLNAICDIMGIKIDGQIYSTDMLTVALKKDVDQLVQNAYENWDSLEEVDASVNENFQPSRGNVVADCSNPQQNMMPYEIVIGGIIEMDGSHQVVNNNLPIEFGDWEASSQNLF